MPQSAGLQAIWLSLCLAALACGTIVHAAEPANLTEAADDNLVAVLQSRFEAVARRSTATVVAISASTTPNDAPSACRVEELSADHLAAFLSKTTRMVGTGFVITADGYVLTNDHVIDDAKQLWVTTDSGVVYPAVVVGSDPRADLAVLKLPAHAMPFSPLDPAAAPCRGQWSMAVGNPFGLSGSGGMSISVGVVSAVHRSLASLSEKQNRLYGDLIQTTAQINPGNSGGPLLDMTGRVIGINTAVVMPLKAVNGIGFALPINGRLVRLVEQLKAGKKIAYGYLGVQVSTPSELERRTAFVPGRGVRVDSVQPRSPADGQIQPGDLLMAVNEMQILDSAGFSQCIAEALVDRCVHVQLLRRGKWLQVETSLKKRPMPATAVDFSTQQLQWAGMTLANECSTEGGLRVTHIRPESPLFPKGLREGVVIHRVAGQSVANIIALQSVINDTPFARCAIDFDAEMSTASIALDR